MITINQYDNGVCSICSEIAGQTMSYGIVPAGEYQFNNSTEERITILDGEATINGTHYAIGDTCIVPAGIGVQILADHMFGYRCTYHN